MTDQAQNNADANLPNVRMPRPRTLPDFATILGLLFTFGLIAYAIMMGQSNASFLNGPSLLIVVFGTVTATCTSFTVKEIVSSWNVIRKSTTRITRDNAAIATGLISLAVIAKKKGVLALTAYESQIKSEPFLVYATRLVVDGYKPEQIEQVLVQKIESQIDRHKRSASITKRASEIAPAMGLIGTLVGLVQMLADLENPESIGPAMALALLTTFYGAILGTIVMAPLAAKLEKNSTDETLFQSMVLSTAVSMAKQENPRNLEMQLNSELPPVDRISFFD